ncbi:MAG: hypothetical protein QM758_15050 [Armatimonas sp.]
MNWRRTGRVWSAALTIGATALVASSASAQRDGYERVLAGIRLNSSAKEVLRKFGNPNQIVIGDVGMRNPPAQGGGAAGGMGGAMGGPMGGGLSGSGGGMMGGMQGRGGAMMGMGGGAPMGMGGSGPMGSSGGGMMGMGGMQGRGGAAMGMGGGAGLAGGPGMMGGGGGKDDGDMSMPGSAGGGGMMGAPGGMGGFGGQGGMMGGGPSTGPFGQNSSTTARQQEVTWIYNRKFKDVKGNTNVVSYEFLIGPGGRISQIRVLGYYSKGTRTQRGVVLGSTYKDLVRLYGYPEEHTVAGGVLIASYKNRAHANFQLIQSKPGADPSLQNYKIIAITIASVE